MLIRFDAEDLQLFRDASHDANPLHISADYARTTAYGEPVVFGILGALAAAGYLRERPDRVLRKAELEFCNALYTDIDYRVEVRKDSDDEALIFIYDASRLMAKSRYWFRIAGAEFTPPPVHGSAARSEAAVWSNADLRPGIQIAGQYCTESSKLQTLAERFGLVSRGFGWDNLTALLWSSYFVGMELPGRQATFWKAQIEFDPSSIPGAELRYEAQLQKLDERFDLLEVSGLLEIGGHAFARAQLWTFLRPESPELSLMRLNALLPGRPNFLGKVAVVIGGSRGLGSATALALALVGCTVYVIYQRSKDQAERLRTLAAGAPGEIRTVQGDASDSVWCRELLDRINQQHGGLDILICNACPPVQPLSFAPETMTRLQRLVNESLALVSVPMSVFLPSLEKKSGWSVIVSSEFVRTTPPQWPHYVTAKCAVEGLTCWAAAQFKNVGFLLVRPPKLLTDQTNTPQGRQGGVEVELIAAAISIRLDEPRSESPVEIIETFGGSRSSASSQGEPEALATKPKVAFPV